jgi:hypothetical protein
MGHVTSTDVELRTSPNKRCEPLWACTCGITRAKYRSAYVITGGVNRTEEESSLRKDISIKIILVPILY